MNLSLLRERWEKARETLAPCCIDTLDKCIRDLTMLASGEMREPYTLDSRSPFKRHNGCSIKDAIDIEQKNGGTFFDWAMGKHAAWFSLN